MLRTDIFEIVGYGEAERVGSEFRVPKNKKSAIFVIIRGSSENCEIRDFWFFGISSSVFRVRMQVYYFAKNAERILPQSARRSQRVFNRKVHGGDLKI